MVDLDVRMFVGKKIPATFEHSEAAYKNQNLYLAGRFQNDEFSSNVFIAGRLHKNALVQKTNSNNPGSCRVKSIIQNYWGTYCAVLIEDHNNRVSVLPEPTGTSDIYFYQHDDGLFVSSSLNWILEQREQAFKPRLGHFIDVAHNLSRYGSGTILNDVYRIPFGHVLRVSYAGNLELERVWPYTLNDRPVNSETVAAELQAILQDVLLKTTEDNTAVLLSGGRDSSLVSGVFHQTRDHTNSQIRFVHLRDSNKSSDELKYANFVSEKCNGRLDYIESSDYLDGFKAQWTLNSVSSNFAMENFANCAHYKTNATSIINGNAGDSIFINEIMPGYLCDLPMTRILGMEIPSTLPDLLYSKGYARVFSKRYLSNLLNDWYHPYIKNNLLTDKANEVAQSTTNYRFFKNSISALLNTTSTSKATYAFNVLQDMLVQNVVHRGSVVPVFTPLVSQPVLDYLFSISLGSFIGKEARSLQKMILRELDMDFIASRRHKTGVDSMYLKNMAEHEDVLLTLLDDGVLNRSGLINMKSLEEVFLYFKVGYTSTALPAVVNMIGQELEYRELGIRG